MPTTSRTAKRANGAKPPAVDIHDIEDQLARLRDDISGLTQMVAAYGTGTAEKAGADFAKNAETTLAAMRTEYEAIEKNLTGKVKSNPLQALGIAMGVGFLAALLTRR